MANPITSGTAISLVTRDDIITAALQNLRVLSIGQSASTSDITLCAFRLGLILNTLNTDGYMSWLYKVTIFPFVAGQSTYTIAETGANITDFRPVRVSHGWRRDNSTPANDIPLTGPISRMDYDNLTPKGSTGLPNTFCYDPQIGLGQLIYWPVPVDATNSGVIAMQRPVQDITASGQNFDVTREWFLPLSWILSDEVSFAYEVDLQTITKIEGKAAYWRNKLGDWSQEDAPSRFLPDPEGSYRGSLFD